jgi:ATP-binding cassette subfamily C (CFTR/MRP) protein 1
VLSGEGKIAQQGNFGDLASQEGYIKNILLEPQIIPKAIQTINGHLDEQPRAQGVVQNEIGDLTRKTGDMAVYKYYFKSIGWASIFGFIGTSAIFAFATYFPRKEEVFHKIFLWILIPCLEIWLEWWTEANGGHIGKYISVYIVLGVGAILFRGLSIWFVLKDRNIGFSR